MALTSVPIRYINLDTAQQRRERLESHFKDYGVLAQRLEAVRWTRLSQGDQESLYSPSLNEKQYHSPLVDGEKGCYASHIEAWRWLLESDHACMVVLEDDVRLTEDFLKVVNSVVLISIPWDMVKLMGRQREKVAATRALCPGFDLIDYHRVPSYTAGYVISKAGAKKMLDTRVPFGRPIDIDIRFWWENGLIVYGVWPSVLLLDETSQVTTIENRKSSGAFRKSFKKLKMKISLTLGNALHRMHFSRNF